jgi:hypothetical protein
VAEGEGPGLARRRGSVEAPADSALSLSARVRVSPTSASLDELVGPGHDTTGLVHVLMPTKRQGIEAESVARPSGARAVAGSRSMPAGGSLPPRTRDALWAPAGRGAEAPRRLDHDVSAARHGILASASDSGE